MSAKTPTAPIQSSRNRKTITKVSAPKGKSHAGGLTHESLAAHIAAFQKAGGHIEVLGHTNFRRGPAPAPSDKAAPPAGGIATAGKKADSGD